MCESDQRVRGAAACQSSGGSERVKLAATFLSFIMRDLWWWLTADDIPSADTSFQYYFCHYIYIYIFFILHFFITVHYAHPDSAGPLCMSVVVAFQSKAINLT